MSVPKKSPLLGLPKRLAQLSTRQTRPLPQGERKNDVSWRKCLIVLPLLFAGGCSFFETKDRFGSRPISYGELEGWRQDNHIQGLNVFISTCPVLTKKAFKTSEGSDITVSTAVWKSLCNDAMAVPPGNAQKAREFFERRFTPYRINNNGREQGLFTGYYEPTLWGSYKKHGNYKYPLYLPPSDLMQRRPYYTHAQINKGVLKNRGLELVWVDDPVMLFFLQIQGSGRVRFKDGSSILVGYAGQNGHPYQSLGKIMGDEGLMQKDQINFFTIRQWLYDNPKRAFELMERNPSYVFFKRLDVSGAVGAAATVLTAQRSIAIDSKYIPYGLPLFLETEIPELPGGSGTYFHRIMIAQDTGGAIRGPVRGDIFFGGGPDSEYLAGYMKGRGVYSLLVPNEITEQMH